MRDNNNNNNNNNNIENNTWMCGNMTFILSVDQDISRVSKKNSLIAPQKYSTTLMRFTRMDM